MSDQPEKVTRLTRWQRLSVASLLVTGVLMVGGSLFVWSGYYNVSASRDHWGFTTWVLELVRDQSINFRTSSISPPPLDDLGMVALGREHYRIGCSSCHSDIGTPQSPIYQNMLPRPPLLEFAAADYDPAALFWIILNGLKYTGMPAWPAEGREDEVWPMVAFLTALHADGSEAYEQQQNVGGLPAEGVRSAAIENCIRCHGDDETPPVSDLVPSLNGRSGPYLLRSLAEYRDGYRESGYMAPIAHGMSDAEMAELAAYYSGLPPARRPEVEANPAAIERGRELAMNGDPERDVPACNSCHVGMNPQFPLIMGQTADYLSAQLQLWQRGGRRSSSFGAIMAVVGARMTDEQIRDVSAYYASLPPIPGAPLPSPEAEQ
jgi:cytochrome c553